MNAVDYIIVKAAREGLTLLGMYDDGRIVSPADDLSQDELIALKHSPSYTTLSSAPKRSSSSGTITSNPSQKLHGTTCTLTSDTV
jgi:hypothetical protein